ncbi:thiamine pyrophosphate-binding protein [Paeniglutamicibacter sulfureus]|uniref:Thiamine pyrophosphate-dependent acetolactate synthase large subunit-like protein n=1 Tax=Paeniglutamicibacter sulfureus TaxID=43666 RepID=A0ABU2BL75_9MICC|nr:thiamine pyrophosphate-binding protein [Paeniglutamicibacter sulfureus]MDR7359394.1 thiamine pyrophosphate-dependent acetolactate synthase large subunit-like protein [Paeniglutamicibacter sulfureus]
MNVAQLVGKTLAELGVGHCFGVVGSGNFTITNALMEHGVPFTAARHEGGAATMADAYSRTSGKVSLLSVHQGCGLTNAATGIGEAAKSRTPMIVLAAEAAPSAVYSNFAMDQDGFAASVHAVAERVHSAASAVADTVRAYRRAVNDRRTVVLNLPLNVQAQEVAGEQATAPPAVVPAEPIRPSRASVQALAGLLAGAQRPVFVAGRGGRGARDEILALAKHTGALVATSAVAKGLFNQDDFNLGISGGFSSPLAAELITGADLIIGFGCALNMWTMRHGHLIGTETKVVQVDLEEQALGANRPIGLGVVGDSAQCAADVLDALVAGNVQAREGYRSGSVKARIDESIHWQQVDFEDLSDGQYIDPRTLTTALDGILPTERIVSVDSGNFMGYPSQFLSVPDEFGFCFTQAFQSIGLGLYTAIGAGLAQPGRIPVLGTGDGGFHMAIAELDTAVRLNMPLVCIVYNDAAYGAEVHHFALEDPEADMSSVQFPDTDFAAIGRGFGADGITVRTLADLDAVGQWVASNPTKPLVIDAKIASDSGSWWLAEAFKGH